MAAGTVSFTARVVGLELQPIDISHSHQAIDRITVETRDNEWVEVVMHLIDVFTVEEAEAITTPIIGSITNRLAYELDISIGEPFLSGATVPKDASESVHSVVKNIPVSWGVAAPTVIPDAAKLQEITAQLEQPYTRPDLYSAYRFAGNQSDGVARFMFLYNILLQLHNDNQGQVDAFVRQKDSNVAQSPRPDKPHITETIYTRLRNEVSHRRQGVALEQTRGEIEGNVRALQKLARTAIADAI